MTTTTRLRRTHLAIVSALCVAALAVVVAGGTSAPAVSAQTTNLGAGGEYHPLTPARIFDSRHGGVGRRPMNPQGSSFNINLLGQGGIPTNAGTVLAVVLNVTVANPDRAGYLSITPAGAGGESSLVNFDASRDVPNLAIVGVGVGGQAAISLVSPSGSGSAHVIVDVYGWISTSGYDDVVDDGSRFVAMTPTRILDTRSAPVPFGRIGGVPLGAREQLRLQIRGNGGIPGGGNITGVMVNITAVNAGGGYTYVSASPNPFAPGTEPPTSVTNLVGGQIKANTAIVPINPVDGAIQLFNSQSSTHLIVDVLGYLESGRPETTTAGRVVPLSAPFRALDTRQAAAGRVPLGFGSVENWSFTAFADSVTLNGAQLGPQAGVIGNLTATGLGRVHPSVQVRSFLTVFPGDVGRPTSSNVNIEEGENVPNMSLLKYGPVGGDPRVISVYNDNGSLHYILDVYAVVLS